MDRTEVIYLVAKDFVQDKYGVQTPVTSERKAYVQVNSVNASEWFEGGRNGLNPELRFTLSRFDYHGEDVVKFNNRYYTVYRTYLGRNDTIELYCEKRKGNADL